MQVMVRRDGVRGTHHQASVLNPFCANEFVGQLLNVTGFAAKNHDFKASVEIKMGMKR